MKISSHVIAPVILLPMTEIKHRVSFFYESDTLYGRYKYYDEDMTSLLHRFIVLEEMR